VLQAERIHQVLPRYGARLSMKLYHRTTAASAEAILRDGFKDGTGHYLTEQLHFRCVAVK
jgi:hypothetical protein